MSRLTNHCSLFCSLLVHLIVGCSGMTATIDTIPDGASIKALDAKSGEFKEIGKTPYQGPIPSKDGQALVRLSLPGYNSETLSIDTGRFSFVDFTVSFEKEEARSNDVSANSAETETAEAVAAAVQIIQQALASNALDSALGKANQLQKDYPKASAVWELLGDVLVAKKNIKMAGAAYKKALEIQPQNRNVRQKIAALKGGSE